MDSIFLPYWDNPHLEKALLGVAAPISQHASLRHALGSTVLV